MRGAALGLALLLAGCGGSDEQQKTVAVGKMHGEAIPVTYAKHFTTERRGNFVVVHMTAPVASWSSNGAPQEQRATLVLAPRSGAAPALTGDLAGATVVRTPVRRIAVNSGAEEAILTALGVADRMVAVGGLMSYDDAVQARVRSGELGQVGYSWHSPPNLDVLLAHAPDLFVMRLANLDHAPSLVRANQLGVPTIPDFLDAETDPLGRAEWIKLFGLLTGREREAQGFFSRVEARVRELRALAAKAPATPVIWAYSGGGDRFVAIVRPMEGRYLSDAGGRNLLARPDDPAQGSQAQLSTEDIITRGARAQCWIAGDIHALKPPPVNVLSAVDAYRTGCLFANTGRMKPKTNGYDWYDSGPIRPDLILADFVAMLHPDLMPGHRFEFLRRIDKVETGEASR